MRALVFGLLVSLWACAPKTAPMVKMADISRFTFGADLSGDLLVCVELSSGQPCMALSEMRRQWSGIRYANSEEGQ